MLRAVVICLLLVSAHAEAVLGQTACTVGTDRPKVDVQPDPIVFPVPSAADFSLGWVMSESVTIKVNPRGRGQDKTWALCIGSDSFDMGGYGKPLSDLEWQVEGGSGWTPVDQANRLVLQGDGRSDVILRFRALLFAERDLPGTYDAILRFTAKKL